TTVGLPGWVYPYSLAIQLVPSTSISAVPSSSSSGSAALRWSSPERAASRVKSAPKRCTVTTTFARNCPSTRGSATATCTPGTVSVSQSSGTSIVIRGGPGNCALGYSTLLAMEKLRSSHL